MAKSHLPLNALRAFEASARHLSFTKAGMELRVGQAAISHQVKGLEARLGVQLFRRLPRGLALTDEGQALIPAIAESFSRLRATLERFEKGHFRGVVSIGVVGTFATGWLLPRLGAFREAHPFVDLRIQTNNNRVDLAGEGLDFATLRQWFLAQHRRRSPLSGAIVAGLRATNCGADQQARRPRRRSTLALVPGDEWGRWFAAAGVASPAIKGTMFDSSVTMAEAAAQGAGVALLPVAMFERELSLGRLVQPFDTKVSIGSYWLTALKSKAETDAMRAFRSWIVAAAQVQNA